MTLSHYTKRAKLGARVAREQPAEPDWKPYGLWVSVDGPDDWTEWCLAEDFCLNALKYRWVVTLKEDANILRLATTWDLVDFTNTYGVDIGLGTYGYYQINWKAVALVYQGIIIAPYNWECRLGDYGEASYRVHHWYYTWDCASGCIWDPSAIASMKRDYNWNAPQSRYPEEVEA